MRQRWRASAAACALILSGWPLSAQAIPASVPFVTLTYLCPSPHSIEFAWQPADGIDSYSLQLAGPLDETINGGISGSFIRQFGTIEVASGQIANASVTLQDSATGKPLMLQFFLMAKMGGSLTGIVPPSQVAIVPIPCTKNTAEVITH
jgi:hypothetical protein